MKRFKTGFDGEIVTAHTNFVSMVAGGGGRKLPPPRRGARGRRTPYHFDPAQCFNVLSERLSAGEAEAAFWGAVRQCEDVIGQFDLVIVPSGRHAHQMGIRAVARETGTPTIFIGYGNLPGKTFFDPWGTDADSRFFHERDYLLRNLPIPGDADRVIDQIMERKRAETTLPQRARPGYQQKLLAVFAADIALQAITGRISDRSARFLLKQKTTSSRSKVTTYDATPNGIFFPLQVSSDPQILLNYDGRSIFTAIDDVAAIGRSEGRSVFYRPHPAEREPGRIEAYIHDHHGDVFLRTAQPVHDVLDVVESVVVVNSTVGLEAMAKRKRVRFLGRSLYDGLSREELATYIDHYLVDVSYFSGPPMTSEMVERIISFSTPHGPML